MQPWNKHNRLFHNWRFENWNRTPKSNLVQKDGPSPYTKPCINSIQASSFDKKNKGIAEAIEVKAGTDKVKRVLDKIFCEFQSKHTFQIKIVWDCEFEKFNSKANDTKIERSSFEPFV